MDNNKYTSYQPKFWKPFLGMSTQDKGFTLVLLVLFVPLIYKIFSPFYILLGFGAFTDTINTTIMVIGLLMSAKKILGTIQIKHYLIFAAFASFIYLSKYIYPSSAGFISENYHDFILYVASCFFIGLAIDYNRDKDILLFVARLGVVVQLYWQLCLILGLVADVESDKEQMSTAYGFLFSVFYLFVEASEHGFYLDKILSVLSIILLLFMGTRGPIMILIFFIAGYLLFFKHYENNEILKKTGILVLFGSIYYFIDFIALFLMGVANSLGLSSRIFESILMGQMTDINESSYRDLFYKSVIKAINADSSGFGYGIGGDRQFTPTGGYTHNFELEMLATFGKYGGMLVLLLMVLMIILCIIRSKTEKSLSFFYVMFGLGVLSLQLSLSWLIYPPFFVFLGYCFSIMELPKVRL